jgi:hypothetical protein
MRPGSSMIELQAFGFDEGPAHLQYPIFNARVGLLPVNKAAMSVAFMHCMASACINATVLDWETAMCPA